MSGKDVAHAINIAFGGIAGTIGAVTAVVQGLMYAWDHASANAAIAARGIAHAFDTVRHGFAQSGHDAAHAFDTARHAVATAGHDIASAFDTVRHDIAAKFDGVRSAIVSKFKGAAAWLVSVVHDIASAFDTVRHDIAAKFDGMRHTVAAKFDGAASWLVSAGADVIQGLINGLESKIPGLSGVIGTITGIVKSVGGALGIHSPSTVMRVIGQQAGAGLMLGLADSAPGVAGASRLLAGAAVSGITQTIHGGTAGYGYGGGDIHVHFNGVTGDPTAAARQVVAVLRAYKQRGGGAPLGIA